jgi:hypothetical protein
MKVSQTCSATLSSPLAPACHPPPCLQLVVGPWSVPPCLATSLHPLACTLLVLLQLASLEHPVTFSAACSLCITDISLDTAPQYPPHWTCFPCFLLTATDTDLSPSSIPPVQLAPNVRTVLRGVQAVHRCAVLKVLRRVIQLDN